MNFQIFKLDLEKAEELEVRLPISFGSLKKKKKREFQINIYFCIIDYAKAFDCVDHNKLWKILKEMGIPDHLTCLLRNLYAGQEVIVRTGHGPTDWFEIEKGVQEMVVYCYPAYLTYTYLTYFTIFILFNLYVQRISYATPGWMKHSWNQDCWEKYQ